MKIINWTLLFLAAFFCCFDSVKANPLRQDTIRDVPYQLYPLGVACRDNDMATIKRLLAGKDEPMAMGIPGIRTLITDYIVTNTG